uniref:Uncharacterized protein n=1 Tax=Chromera velia CCMP2878 TaxID=1169474 RepID=A0A0G4HF01_9ALVE|eukprot:Cvel_6617.t1-p1 / transcript=Cvel_6617.t1 / gene=Cvel_6617 / organism=Chromera_velia_CCMP2878 / gene_product=hypothetical protein / transcript_product=hypothetical protein / location=Cvel_scaffold327:72633-83574(+) / protein_length=233 / sequence_SO=supercontig / SO=protein_coding / is_pseudo=false
MRVDVHQGEGQEKVWLTLRRMDLLLVCPVEGCRGTFTRAMRLGILELGSADRTQEFTTSILDALDAGSRPFEAQAQAQAQAAQPPPTATDTDCRRHLERTVKEIEIVRPCCGTAIPLGGNWDGCCSVPCDVCEDTEFCGFCLKFFVRGVDRSELTHDHCAQAHGDVFKSRRELKAQHWSIRSAKQRKFLMEKCMETHQEMAEAERLVKERKALDGSVESDHSYCLDRSSPSSC